MPAEKNTYGYEGEPLCGQGCPARVGAAVTCKLMVLCTEARDAAKKALDLAEAQKWHIKHGSLAAELGCKPGIDRI